MTCSIPICALIERTMANGKTGMLMANDLPSALSEAATAQAAGDWFAHRITMGRDFTLEGDALAQAIREATRPPE
jgi:hypothetical protein